MERRFSYASKCRCCLKFVIFIRKERSTLEIEHLKQEKTFYDGQFWAAIWYSDNWLQNNLIYKAILRYKGSS